jgi:hypothetical protein
MPMTALRYIELKSSHKDNGPAWIGHVGLSRSKTTVYFNGRALKRLKGGGVSSNYVDIESGEAFWISGVKKKGEDRHWAGSGRVLVEEAALSEYLAIRGLEKLDPARYEITTAIVQTDITRFLEIENRTGWNPYAEEDAEIK